MTLIDDPLGRGELAPARRRAPGSDEAGRSPEVSLIVAGVAAVALANSNSRAMDFAADPDLS
jgi:hypothetical protein